MRHRRPYRGRRVDLLNVGLRRTVPTRGDPHNKRKNKTVTDKEGTPPGGKYKNHQSMSTYRQRQGRAPCTTAPDVASDKTINDKTVPPPSSPAAPRSTGAAAGAPLRRWVPPLVVDGPTPKGCPVPRRPTAPVGLRALSAHRADSRSPLRTSRHGRCLQYTARGLARRRGSRDGPSPSASGTVLLAADGRRVADVTAAHDWDTWSPRVRSRGQPRRPALRRACA